MAVIAVALLVLVGFLVWRTWFETYHLATVQDGVLYREGNRSLREFRNTVRQVKPKLVVSLIDDREMSDPGKPEFQDEAAYLKEQGIELKRIPVKLGGWPMATDVAGFLSAVSDAQNRPVIVHCAQGVRRTGMMVAAYQIKALGYDKAKAKASVLTFGHSRRTVGDVERFIDGYDPETGAVPDGPIGQE